MQRAACYYRKSKFYMHAYSRTTDGLWIAAEPYSVLDVACADAELGLAIRQALDGSNISVPAPANWNTPLMPLLANAAVKSWTVFASSASCLEVEQSQAGIHLIPMANLGPKDGFAPRLEDALVGGPASAELGKQARAILLSK